MAIAAPLACSARAARRAWLAVSVTAALGVACLVPQSAALAQSRTARVAADARAGALAGVVMPGFETLADGSSRLFVELSKPVAYDTKAARGSVTYVLRGAHVLRRNNTNPLVTVYFDTPVTTARLVPHGHDLWFVVELRADVRPAVTMDAGKDGSAVMRIELPKGSYLPAGAPVPSAPGDATSAPSAAASTPAPSGNAPSR
jgi:hypothetical protein